MVEETPPKVEFERTRSSYVNGDFFFFFLNKRGVLYQLAFLFFFYPAQSPLSFHSNNSSSSLIQQCARQDPSSSRSQNWQSTSAPFSGAATLPGSCGPVDSCTTSLHRSSSDNSPFPRSISVCSSPRTVSRLWQGTFTTSAKFSQACSSSTFTTTVNSPMSNSTLPKAGFLWNSLLGFPHHSPSVSA